MIQENRKIGVKARTPRAWPISGRSTQKGLESGSWRDAQTGSADSGTQEEGLQGGTEGISDELLMIQQESASRQRMDWIDRDSERMATRLEQVVQSFKKCIESGGGPEAEGDLGLELTEFEDWARG